MYERSYGYKYEEPGNDTGAASIAKRMRADIKQAVSEGLLRGDATYSVTSESFAGGQAINIDVKDWTDAWVPCDGLDGEHICRDVWCLGRVERFNDEAYREHAKSHDVLSDEAKSAKMTLERIHGAYNHDGSDIQSDYFDVRYYGHVQFEDAWRAESRAKEAADIKARRAAIDEAAKAETFRLSISKATGNTVHLATKVNGRTVLVCGARPSRYSPIRETDSAITCSRCAKRDAS